MADTDATFAIVPVFLGGQLLMLLVAKPTEEKELNKIGTSKASVADRVTDCTGSVSNTARADLTTPQPPHTSDFLVSESLIWSAGSPQPALCSQQPAVAVSSSSSGV